MSDIKDTLDRLDALRANVTGGVVNANGNSNADYLVALLNAYPLLRAALLEMREERDAERLRYGQQAARNAAFMLGLARLARMESSIQGIGELVRGIVAEADRAAADVRLEDFTTAAVAKGGGK